MIKKIIKLVGVLFLVAIGVTGFYGDKLVETYLLKVINQRLNEPVDRIYNWRCKKVQVNVFDGDLSLIDLKIYPRLNSKDSLASFIKEVPLLIEGTIAKVVIEGFSWGDIWYEDKLSVEDILIDRADIGLLVSDSNKDKGKLESFEYSEAIAEWFNEVGIGRVHIKNGVLHVSNFTDPTKKILELDSLSFSLHDIYIDSLKSQRNPFWFYENLEFTLKEIRSSLGDKYKLKANNLHVSASRRFLGLENIEIRPYVITESDTIDGVNRDYFTLDVDKIELLGIDFKKVIKTSVFDVGNIEVVKPKLVYLLDGVNKDTVEKELTLPSNKIRNIQNAISIDQLKVVGGDIDLKIKIDPKREPVKISFNDLYVKSNDLRFGEESIEYINLKIQANAYLQGEGKIETEWLFPLNDKKDQFHLKGSLGSMDMAVLNSFLESYSFVTLSSGQLHNMDFDITANNEKAEGSLLLDYSGLTLRYLKELTSSEQGRRRKYYKLRSYMANNVLKSKNNPKAMFYRQGYVNVERSVTTGVWQYVWDCFYSGITNCLIKTENTKKRKIRKYRKGV